MEAERPVREAFAVFPERKTVTLTRVEALLLDLDSYKFIFELKFYK